MQELAQEVKRLEPKIIGVRRAIHQNPELAHHEVATARLVARELRTLGLEVKMGVGGTGVVGLIRSGKKGKVVALRADMDALPIQEDVEVPFKSHTKGVMHACGHDSHVAMLLGAAALLVKQKTRLGGDVKLIFQPAEEQGGRGGAKPMIEDGVMEDPKVDYVFGLHISSDMPSGVFGIRAGPFMAKPDAFKIRVIGRGGHGSSPHRTVDPVYIAAQVIIALQGVSGRMVNPIRPFVVSVCSVHGGTKSNVIPDEVLLEGTIRSFDKDTRSKAIRDIKQAVTSTCRAYGGSCYIDFQRDTYPVVRNDEKVTERVARTLRKMPGMKTKTADIRLGAEDFSRFQQRAPGTFYYLGTYNPSKGCTSPNHSAQFKIAENVLKYGALSLANVTLEFSK